MKLWDIDGWTFASRRPDPSVEPTHPDAVIIVPILQIGKGYSRSYRLVVIDEYRKPLNGREIAFPAGLVDPKESILEAARRELMEETGLEITNVRHVSPIAYTSAGMTDENSVFVVADVKGIPTSANQEASEDIKVLTLTEEEAIELAEGRGSFAKAKISAKMWPFLYSWRRL